MARVGRTSLTLVPIALASRGAAFGVPVVIAWWFGVEAVTDAWFWALAFPTFVLVLASTAMGTAATPILAETRQKQPEHLGTVIGGMVGWTALVAGGAGVCICLAGPTMLAQLTDFDSATQQMASSFLWELWPFMVLTATGAVLRVACEIHERFVAVAITPLIRAGVVILMTWLLMPSMKAHALSWGLVAGEAVQFLWWSTVLARSGVRFRLGVHLHPRVKQMGKDLLPILGGEALVTLNLVVDKAFAAWLPTGSVATLEFADRARVIPQTLLESTLLMVAYASWSNMRAQNQLAEARKAVEQSLRWVLALAAPILAGLFIGRHVLIQLLFEHDQFTPENTAATASVLAWYLPGVWTNLLGIMVVRAHVVEHNLRLIWIMGAVCMVSNCLLNALLIGPMGLEGLALATTLNMIIVPGIYLWALRKRLPWQMGSWLKVGGIAAASVTVACLVEMSPDGHPQSIASLKLWGASIPCFVLLGFGWRVTQAPRKKHQ